MLVEGAAAEGRAGGAAVEASLFTTEVRTAAPMAQPVAVSNPMVGLLPTFN